MKGKQSPPADKKEDPPGTVMSATLKLTHDPKNYRNPNSVLKAFKQWVQNPENKATSRNVPKNEPETDTHNRKGTNVLKGQRADVADGPDVKGGTNHERQRAQDPLVQNVHISSPSTTQQKQRTDSQKVDIYRVRYLLLKVEQQLAHTKHIIQQMQARNAKRSSVTSVAKVMKEIFQIRQQLLHILDNDHATLAKIGNADDLEQFFQNVEKICAAAEEITFEAERKETESNEKKKLGLFGRLTAGKGRRSKQSQSQSSVCEVEARNEKLHDTRTEDRSRDNRQDGDGQSGDVRRRGATDLYCQSGPVESLFDRYTGEEKTDEETAHQRYKWALLNTTDEQLLEKEMKLHNLMVEIDGLMEEVGLSGMKQSGFTYEILPRGSGEKNVEHKPPLPSKLDGNKAESRSKKVVKKSVNQPDKFDMELERLLAECDKKK